MGWFIARRILLACVSLLGVTFIASGLLQLSGDPVALMFQSGVADPAQVEALRHDLMLDRPMVVQFAGFVSQMAQGDLGESLRFRRPAAELIFERLPATLLLAAVAMAFALLVAIPSAIASAVRPGHIVALFGRMVVLIGQSVPLFWLGILLVLIFSVRLRWLPAAGNQRPFSILLPAVTLGLYPMARIARTLRISLQDALRQDYIVTARSKGLGEGAVIVRHALRNAALPLITVVGLQFGTLLGGAIVTETIFSWPGIGLLSIQAVQARDLPLVRALIAVVAIMFILVNLLTDIAYAWLNPRVKLR
jgi:ABC-type dipeptide/oligopeptide/nickel transport system permease component